MYYDDNDDDGDTVSIKLYKISAEDIIPKSVYFCKQLFQLNNKYFIHNFIVLHIYIESF